MKITIEIDHEDIVKATELNFEAFFVLLQSFTKSLRVGEENILREKVDERHAKKSANVAEKNFNRAEIEAEIKKIALENKEKGASKIIKELLHSYGVEKLSELPDDKMAEFLAKVEETVK